MVRQMMDSNEFFEVFIDTPLSVAEERDVKGLYAKARSGQIKIFTGIDSSYEIPKNPDIHIKTIYLTIDEAAEQILKKIIL
jgi:bifunctional enzyme CysN/CysC